MDAQTGRILASIAFTIPVIWGVVLIRRHRHSDYRWIVAGFMVSLVIVAGVYWVLTLNDHLGITDRQIQPFFQMAMIVLGPAIAVKMELDSKRELLLQELREKIRQANRRVNGDG